MIFIVFLLPKAKAPSGASQKDAPRVLKKHGSTLNFHSFMRVTRAAREGIFSLRLGSGGRFPIREPLSA